MLCHKVTIIAHDVPGWKLGLISSHAQPHALTTLGIFIPHAADLLTYSSDTVDDFQLAYFVSVIRPFADSTKSVADDMCLEDIGGTI